MLSIAQIKAFATTKWNALIIPRNGRKDSDIYSITFIANNCIVQCNEKNHNATD